MAVRSVAFALEISLIAALLCITVSGCKEKNSDQPLQPTAEVAPVTRGDISKTIELAGEFLPYQEIEVHAKVSGYIRRISVDIGDRVAAGQVIAVLEVPELSAQVAGAQAQVRHSLSEIDRAKSGVALEEASYSAVHAAYTRLAQAAKMPPGLVAEQELDDSHAKDLDAQARVNAARSALEASQEQLGVAQAEDRRVSGHAELRRCDSPF